MDSQCQHQIEMEGPEPTFQINLSANIMNVDSSISYHIEQENIVNSHLYWNRS